MNTTKEYLSKEKFEQLKEELHTLKTVTRKEVAGQLEYAKSFGDLSENAEYHEARERQADIEDRISELEEIMKTAVIITGKHGSSAVDIGSAVTVKRDGKEETYKIVGAEEADITQNKISYLSPIGSALIGKGKGDEVSVKTPRGETKYKILEVK
ncbi:MAG: transcription elongation factor GreA [bacterium]